MIIGFMMKPTRYLWIRDLESVEINICWTERYWTEYHVLKIISRDWEIESQKFQHKITDLIRPQALFESAFLII